MSAILARPQCFKLLLHICFHLKSNFSVRDLNCNMVWQHTSLVTGGSIKAYNAELWCVLCCASATCWKSSRVDHDLRHHDAHVTSLYVINSYYIVMFVLLQGTVDIIITSKYIWNGDREISQRMFIISVHLAHAFDCWTLVTRKVSLTHCRDYDWLVCTL